jgi:hypothetical protein
VEDQDEADVVAAECASDLGDMNSFLEVLARLRAALGEARGKIRVSDAHRLAGYACPSDFASRLIARSLRHLGWERGRHRFNGTISYAYAKGTRLQREAILDVSSADAGQLVVKRREP